MTSLFYHVFSYLRSSKLNGNLKFFPLNTLIAAKIIITKLNKPTNPATGASTNPKANVIIKINN